MVKALLTPTGLVKHPLTLGASALTAVGAALQTTCSLKSSQNCLPDAGVVGLVMVSPAVEVTAVPACEPRRKKLLFVTIVLNAVSGAGPPGVLPDSKIARFSSSDVTVENPWNELK